MLTFRDSAIARAIVRLKTSNHSPINEIIRDGQKCGNSVRPQEFAERGYDGEVQRQTLALVVPSNLRLVQRFHPLPLIGLLRETSVHSNFILWRHPKECGIALEK